MADEYNALATPSKTAVLAKLLQRDPEKEKAHYEAFGRFIAAFSAAESEIHTLTRHYSGTDDTRARIILGGQRISDAIDRLRALIRSHTNNGLLGRVEATTAAQRTLIEYCLAQFIIIGERRDKLVHRTISFDDAGLRVSNSATAKNLLTAELRLLITDQDLKDMRFDCFSIFLIFADLEEGKTPSAYVDAATGLPAWRYKPPPPVPQKGERPLNRRARKRQQRASPE